MVKSLINIVRNAAKNPDAWAVAISAVALVFSIMAWTSTRQQVRLSAGQIKSYVQVVEAKLEESITAASFIKVRLKIKNFGQTAATDVHGEMDYDVGMPGPNGEGNSATRRDFGSMGPGMEKSVVLTSNRINRRDWPPPRTRLTQTVYFFGTIWYIDDTTYEKRKEDWCYALPLRTEEDLRRTDPEPCDILTYQSKDKG